MKSYPLEHFDQEPSKISIHLCCPHSYSMIEVYSTVMALGRAYLNHSPVDHRLLELEQSFGLLWFLLLLNRVFCSLDIKWEEVERYLV